MNRERAEAFLRLLAEEELRRAAARSPDGLSGGRPEDGAVRPAGVSGTVAGSVAVPDGLMASGRGWGADRAVTELYSVHYRALVRLAAMLVRDVQVAEDVVQDSFVAMRGSWQRLGDTDKALAYLRQSVVNRSRSVLRHRPVPGSGLRHVLSGGSGEHLARVARVAQVLTAVGALDEEVADQILGELELTLAIRQAGSLGRGGPGPGSWRWSSPMRPRPRPAAGSGTTAGAGAAPARVVRLGQVIPVPGEDASGEVYLLSYAQTASGPQLSLFARDRLWSVRPGPPERWASRLEQFTATDDRGTSYQLKARDLGGGPDGWTLMLHPGPPYDPRWLDLATIVGEPAVRVDLHPSARAPQDATVTVSAATASPGEHLLHAVAARLLAAPAADLAAPGPGPPATAADGLGDVIAALQAAGALSPLSPVPGQLAALCARLHLTGHGITAPPARNLPGPWLSMLAHYYRRKTGAARDGCAAAAVTLPGIDGITLAILGLHNCQGRTVVHVHASGPMCQAAYWPDELYYWPVTWIRDSGGRWHATRIRGQSGTGGQTALRVEVVPPLSRTTTWIEVVTAGRSAQARARLPLRWE
jgi:DNA-directed RNA polymerase specialized sigma24 family protein